MLLAGHCNSRLNIWGKENKLFPSLFKEYAVQVATEHQSSQCLLFLMTHLSLASTHISVYYPFFPYCTSLYSTTLCNIHDSNTDCCSIIGEEGASFLLFLPRCCSEDLITFISGVRNTNSISKLSQKKKNIWAYVIIWEKE